MCAFMLSYLGNLHILLNIDVDTMLNKSTIHNLIITMIWLFLVYSRANGSSEFAVELTDLLCFDVHFLSFWWLILTLVLLTHLFIFSQLFHCCVLHLFPPFLLLLIATCSFHIWAFDIWTEANVIGNKGRIARLYFCHHHIEQKNSKRAQQQLYTQ